MIVKIIRSECQIEKVVGSNFVEVWSTNSQMQNNKNKAINTITVSVPNITTSFTLFSQATFTATLSHFESLLT